MNIHRETSTAQQLDGLLVRMAQGDAEALAEFYRITQQAAYAFALSLLRDPQDAQDILQDTYLRAWRMAGTYRPGGKPMGWLLTILRNLAWMHLRSAKRTTPVNPEDLDSFFARQPAVTSEDRILLKAALLELADEERQIVLLHTSGLKHREIAQLLGLKLGTVLSKYHRALKKLQSAWEECEP